MNFVRQLIQPMPRTKTYNTALWFDRYSEASADLFQILRLQMVYGVSRNALAFWVDNFE